MDANEMSRTGKLISAVVVVILSTLLIAACCASSNDVPAKPGATAEEIIAAKVAKK